MRERVPDWMVERLAAGDLAADRAARLREELAERGELARLGRIAGENEQFLAAHPAERVAAEVRRRAGAVTSPRVWMTRVAVPVLAIAVLSIVLLRRSDPGAVARGGNETEVVRLKGLRPHLVVYRKTAGGAERLADRARARPGDTIQVAYVAAGDGFGVIASIDGRGAVTLHLPEEPGQAAALARGGETSLPHAFVLDDSPGFERFVFITGDRPFATAAAVDVLRGAPPPHVATSEFVLEKELP